LLRSIPADLRLIFMANGKRKHRARQKSCRNCFAYIRTDSRKCKYCGYIYKSQSQYWTDKLVRALRIDRAFPILKEKTNGETEKFFSGPEIEKLMRLDNVYILMFMSLDDISLLDEMTLIELGETLTKMHRH
jgi:hypothetical protein